jgi:hypothetical protein
MLRDTLLEAYRKGEASHQSLPCRKARKTGHPLALAEHTEGEHFYHRLQGATSVKVNYAADSILAYAPKPGEQAHAFGSMIQEVPLMPPYPVLWLEWTNIMGEGYTEVPSVRSCGTLLEVFDASDAFLSDPANLLATGQVVTPLNAVLHSIQAGLANHELRHDDPDPTEPYFRLMRWVVLVTSVCHLSKGPLRLSVRCLLSLTKEGLLADRVLYADSVLQALKRSPHPQDRHDAEERWRIGEEMASYCVSIASWACALMHCKNMVLPQRAVAPAVQHGRHLDRKYPLTEYHVLTLDPLKTPSLARAHAAGLRVNDVRLHMARGHFRTYGGERPDGTARGLLFGKLAGTYWIPSQMRGHVEAGVIAKDYALGEQQQ